MKAPLFSLLILCWNSNAYLIRCLASLQEQLFKDFEVILVDNGSSEPVTENKLEPFKDLDIQYFRLEKNIGFAAGNNYAARLARGKYLVLLNTDAFPQSDWLEVMRQAIDRHPNSSFASRLVVADIPQILDGEGDNYHAAGIAWRKAHRQRVVSSTSKEREVFSACGAAAVYPKAAYEQLQGFDEDFFAYYEDVDLGFRLRLMGIPCIYLPSAVVQHVGSGSTSRRSDFSVYYGQRNMVWTYFKNMPGLLLVVLFPGHLLMNMGMVFVSSTRKQGSLTWRAKRDAVANLRTIFPKRRKIQKMRKVSILSLIKVIDWNPFSPITKLLLK